MNNENNQAAFVLVILSLIGCLIFCIIVGLNKSSSQRDINVVCYIYSTNSDSESTEITEELPDKVDESTNIENHQDCQTTDSSSYISNKEEDDNINVESNDESGSNEDEDSNECEIDILVDRAEIELLARMLWGEARGCDYECIYNCVVTVCNRVDDDRWPSDIYSVVLQPNQYVGFSYSNPVEEWLCNIAERALIDWKSGKELPEYNSFWGDGFTNHFYKN